MKHTHTFLKRLSRRPAGVLLSSLLLCCLVLPEARAQVSYTDFSDTTGLQLNGSAAVTPGGVLRLTPANYWQAGSVFSQQAINLGAGGSFSTHFSFRITENGGAGAGADGIVFTVQSVSNTVGGAGIGIGYEGLANSLGVEFDTYDNGGYNDPNNNHTAFDFNGVFSPAGEAYTPSASFKNGDIWNVWIDYEGPSQTLTLRLNETSNVRPFGGVLAATIDLPALLGTNQAYVGFTSATGAGYGNHDILNWELRGDFDPIGVPPITTSPVPEPSTYGLMGAVGLAGLALRRRQRGRARERA